MTRQRYEAEGREIVGRGGAHRGVVAYVSPEAGDAMAARIAELLTADADRIAAVDRSWEAWRAARAAEAARAA